MRARDPSWNATPAGLHVLAGLPDRFDLRGELGAGGMGIVYRAFDRELGAEVAVKTLRKVDVRDLLRLKQEFRSVADLAHPNLAKLYELVVDGDQALFTMEVVDGEPFVDFVRRGEHVGRSTHGTLAERLAATIPQLVAGLSTIHAAGLLHRDVKPSNVLVTPTGRVVLLDFGLAFIHGGDHSVDAVGPPHYMSPEQALGRPLTPATDWYGVGVMLFEALTGCLPFDGSWPQLISDQQRGLARPPSALAPATAPALDRLVEALLDPHPDTRPDGAAIVSAVRGDVHPLRDPYATPAFGTTSIELTLPTSLARGLGSDAPPDSPARGATAADGLGPEPATSAPFVGRDAELEVLARAARRVSAEGAVVVRIRGVSGVGKSELIRRFLRRHVTTRSTLVLRSRCHPHESVPYRAFDQIVDELSRFLGRLPRDLAQAFVPLQADALIQLFPVLAAATVLRGAAPSVQAVEPQERRRQGFAALKELLARVAARQRLVMWIDDLQWGDADSAALLRELARGPRAPAMLLILSHRSEAPRASPLLEALDSRQVLGDEVDVTTLDLEPLGDEPARELIERIAGPRPPGMAVDLAALARESGGLPFFANEIARALRRGLVRHGSRPADIVAELIAERLAELSAAERAIVETAAVAGAPLEQHVILRAARVPGSAGVLVYDLVKRQFLRATTLGGERALVCFHDRLRETIVAQLAPAALRDGHRQLVDALIERGGENPGRLVGHLIEAGERALATSYARLAAERAEAALAFDQAAELYELRLELAADGEGRALRVRLARALAFGGRGARAGAVYEEAARLGAPRGDVGPDDVTLRRLAAEQYLHAGEVERGRALMREVLAALAIEVPASVPRAIASAMWNRARAVAGGFRFERRDEAEIEPAILARLDTLWAASTSIAFVDNTAPDVVGVRHLREALTAGEPSRVLRSLAYEAAFELRIHPRLRERSLRILREVRRLADETGRPYDRAWQLSCEAVVHWLSTDWKSSIEAAERAIETYRLQCVGAEWEVAVTNIFLLAALAYRGDLTSLAARVDGVLDAALDRGDQFAANIYRMGLPALRHLAADAPERALAEADGAIASWPRDGFFFQHYHHLLAVTQAHLYDGRPWDAWRVLTEAWPGLKAAQFLAVAAVRMEMLHLRGRIAVAAAASHLAPPAGLARWRPRRLLRRAARDASTLRGLPLPAAPPLAESLRAGIAEARGDRARAVRLWREAIDRYDAVHMELHARSAELHLAGLLTDEDDAHRTRARASVWFAAQEVAAGARLADLLMPPARR
ncbi:MAG: AAA family ATPase [Deltaproteobacteria bacterium]|nr:AAA family ATPase [Deltaproteobacteria bacterium]